MAKVPDLGSDFAQKLLKDLRRRRERLGFESAAAQRGTVNAAPREAYLNSQKPLQAQKPRQAAPRVGRSEAATNRLHRQGNNSITGPGKPSRHDAQPIAHSHAIVPFQGGGSKPKPSANVDMQMALALALSNRGKLQNIQLVARNGDNYHLPRSAHVGKVAIRVQKLNDILMSYSSSGGGARDFGRRSSVEMGKQLLRGAMDLEKSLSMLMMLQDASDYMESSGNGKVLLLEGTESRRSSTRSSTSARLVEIADEDSEADQGDDAKSSSDASMQIVPHRKSQSSSPNHSSALQLTTVTNSSRDHASSGENEDTKVRMPNLIAKLMGLDNLPSAKAAAERKGTERFVKPEALPRKATATNAMVGPLPIRIVASERVPSKGQIKNLLAREWNISLTKSEEIATATVLSSRPSHAITDRQTRKTMRQVLSKQQSSERRVSLSQVVDEKIVHQNMKLTEESKLQKPISVGCRNDVGKKMGFLQRFRKNANNKPVKEEINVIQENNRAVGKKQTASMNLLLGKDSEVKSRRTKEKFNKENLASTEVKSEGKNGKTDQVRRQAQSKQTDKRIMAKKAQNYGQMQTETPSQKLEDKKSLKPETMHTKQKLEYSGVIQQKNEIWNSKPSDNTPGNGGIFVQSTGQTKDNSTVGGTSSDQSERQKTEEIDDTTSAVALTSEDSKVLDQDAIAETNADRINQKAGETIQIPGTCFEKEQQRQHQPEQMTEVKDQQRDGLDHATESSSPTDLRNQKMEVVSCDSFTENQLLLTEMLLKDHYLLETAKAITGIHVPVSVADVNTGKWLDKSNQVLSDIGREVIRRKCKRTEAMVDVSMTRASYPRLQTLDDLIRELDSDIQSLNLPKKPHHQNGDSIAEKLKMVLLRDIHYTHSDANSMWDFGWNHLSDLPIERNEVVKDLEKNILGGIITDVARELIEVSIYHGCCACEA